MRIHILIYSIFLLLMPVFPGCVSKPGSKTNVQNQETIQNSTANPSILAETDTLAGDSVNQVPLNRNLKRRGKSWRVPPPEGKIVLFICIDRTGKVTSAKFDPDLSSITHAKYASKAEEYVKQYVFEKDLTAPFEECGNFSFVFRWN